MQEYRLLPLNFRELDNKQVVISNLTNNYMLLESKEVLNQVVDGYAPAALRHHLEEGSFIASERDFESKVKLTTAAYAQLLRKDLLGQRLIMIVPTLRCDHSCTYCQVSRANQNETGFDLPSTTIPQIIEFIKRVEKPPYKIEFQGGEPLLAENFIKEFYTQFEKAVGSQNFSIIIASSLSLLNDDFLDFAKNRKIGFSTSIDAGHYAHNKHRKLITKNSFELMRDSVNKISQVLGGGRVGSVTTITKEGKDYHNDLVDVHLNLGLQDLFVRPVSPFGFAANRATSVLSNKEFVDFLRSLILRLVDEYHSGSVIIEHFFFIHYKRLINAAQGGYVDLMSPAGYAKQSLIIDYTGNIFGSDEARMIFRRHGGNQLILGNVKQPSATLDTHFSHDLLSSSFNFDIPGCNECVYQTACGSDPIYHLQEQGEPIGNKSESAFCDLHKRVFDLVIELMDNPINNSVFEKWLEYE
ncbi:His-Xaa-Ser system radical SAM maturase HxsB [Pseudoalteromonas sp. OOF1S-7]|uniref:His-Xaa-Ser system radical SAM maturase HxsB n=1 Tax=Pseudoalteromonas sp. OOF1S-7 TaxID=2917757 RepID=UPI001EF4E960|nr:His-Xaa-Ser system radical SAM maturase HxsB [Pseudoalteromonas sp. OOF1S-7]MCG7535811.1 His-Xaa-Ser system radical SAM maturase HxsB [Pseudoalteromonas sp. OOF1S-7]